MASRIASQAGVCAALMLVALACSCAPGASGAAPGAPGVPLGDPKPGPIKIQIDAALRNLSLAACPNKTAELLSVLAANVTVLFPWADPLLLNTTDTQEAFFSSSFLPCGVTFTVSDISVGSGTEVPKPVPAPIPPTGKEGEAAGLGDDKTKPLAVTRLLYVSYGALDVGKALALWEGEKVKSADVSGGNDLYSWKLTVIGWNSDLSDAAFMARRRRRPDPDTSASVAAAAAGVPEMPRSDASLAAAVGAQGEGMLSFLRRDLLGKKPVDQGKKSVDQALGLGLGSDDDGALLWPLLNATFGYFAENCSGLDLGNASLLFSRAVPYVYGEPGSPPVVVVSEQEHLDWTEQFLGVNWTLEFQSVWSVKLNDDSVGLTSRGGGSAFTITKLIGLRNGTYAFYGHNLMLWDAMPPPPRAGANLVGDSKASQLTIRWELFSPLYPPAPAPAPAPAPTPAPAPAPAPVPAPGTEEAAPAPEEASPSPPPPRPRKHHPPPATAPVPSSVSEALSGMGQ